jgi:hypothetical protein
MYFSTSHAQEKKQQMPSNVKKLGKSMSGYVRICQSAPLKKVGPLKANDITGPFADAIRTDAINPNTSTPVMIVAAYIGSRFHQVIGWLSWKLAP